MSSAVSDATGVTAAFFEAVLSEIQRGNAVRRKLPGGGRIYLDRPLPFICIYRQPENGKDPGTWRLVTSEAAFLIGNTHKAQQAGLRRLVQAIAKHAINRFGAFLVVEIWAATGSAISDDSNFLSPVPGFHVFAHSKRGLSSTLEVLTTALGRIRILKHAPAVELTQAGLWGQAVFKPLLQREQKQLAGLRVIGLEVQPVYRNEEGEIFPMVLRRLKRQISVALKRTFHRFATEHSLEVPMSYQALGQHRISKHVISVDRALSNLAATYDFLLDVTPVNLDSAWHRFKRAKFDQKPVFFYRPLSVDPAAVKRRLFAVSTERIEEPTLADLFREKQLGIDQELSALLARGTSRFIHHGLLLYGGIDEDLVCAAEDILVRIPPRSREGKGFISATDFAERARVEIAHYRRQYPDFRSRVEVRDDLYSGLMVSRGNLLIGRKASIPQTRLDALLQHEIGTHALTYHAGRAQPLHLLWSGLPGYEEFQEGIAVLSEYLVGGLSRTRLRLLAGRVVAVKALLSGASFLDTFIYLTRDCGFDQKAAFTIAARTYRGGGLVKDAIYLRGVRRVMRYIAKGGDFKTLLIGKIAGTHVSMIQELIERKILKPAPVWPRYLGDPAAQMRLSRLRKGGNLFDLTKGGV
ncbi:MAG: DUF1704 domain-containing protein [Myxococcota bacterium]|nr:DUF1704 domain-containing protein [Myxococcota bacterium]